jgi:hypothetical protein
MRFGRIYAVCYGVVVMDVIHDVKEQVEQLYSEWMFDKYIGLKDTHQIICMIEDSADWQEFLESSDFTNYIEDMRK